MPLRREPARDRVLQRTINAAIAKELRQCRDVAAMQAVRRKGTTPAGAPVLRLLVLLPLPRGHARRAWLGDVAVVRDSCLHRHHRILVLLANRTPGQRLNASPICRAFSVSAACFTVSSDVPGMP